MHGVGDGALREKLLKNLPSFWMELVLETFGVT
jgi:hypothetical protein